MTALLVGAPAASGHPGQPSAVFDPDETAWAGLRDRTMVEFDADLQKWGVEGGFLPVDLEVDTFTGEPSFGGAFQHNADKRRWFVDTVMTEPEYDTAFAEAERDGLRLVDRELYPWKGQWYVAAAWVENKEGLGWAARYGLTVGELRTFVKDQKRAGRMPIDFDMFRTSAGLRYGVVVLDNPEHLAWHLHDDLTDAQFATTFAAYQGEFRMLSFDSAIGAAAGASAGTQLFGGIWVENRTHRGWIERREMSAHSYANNWHRDADEGYRQIFVGRYETTAGVRYAAI
ncbi:hypothetical protein O7635_24140 [Asanoa sp. WMMD1127]|uniref:hypothetical protein n=1 Tax=Asanoa sp. WMMD1127 TaxID=3016107 RepID=UPI0024175BE6|nr:hypothetical protein [Asanoa sp. WMMD1127]MDG4824951.1 hypothetical protein [Asanoa sp. WMMD1127]